MKKLFMSFMAMLLSGVMCMPAVFADESFGTVTDITGSDTVHGDQKPTATITPTGGNAQDVTITYTDVNLKKVAAGDNGRPEGYAWLGFKIEKSDNKENAKVRQTFTGYSSSEWADVEQDGMYYAGIDEVSLEAMVESGQNVFVVYEFDWNGDGTTDQTVTIVIDPAEVTLYDVNDADALWNEDIYQEVLDSLTPEDPTIPDENTSTDNNTSSTVKVNKKANLDDVPKTGVIYSVINYLA